MANLDSKEWRLNNLYRIVDRNGNSIPFKLNAVQREVCACPHNRKLILKSRQLGMSTYAVLDILDDALFNSNLACGIVSYSLEHAQHIFKRIIGHALETFLPELKSMLGILSQSAREITFSNGSFLRVDTSLRGGSYPAVLISEFGKTCARSPLKAEEVVTGTLQAVPAHGKVIIESTAEGSDGFFCDMVTQAAQRGNNDLTELEYHLSFFPWYTEPSYRIQKPITYETELDDYFDKLEMKSKDLISKEQRYWYVHQRSILGDKIKQEFCSTVAEAFLSSSDAYYYALCIEKAHKENRVLYTPIYDALLPVYVAMDIGATDLTCMIFFQVVHGEIRIIDYYQDNNKGVDFYARFLLQDKNYLLHTIFLPHDAVHRDGIVVENTYEREFRKLFSHTQVKFMVLKRTDVNVGIANAKMKFDRCVFDIRKTKTLIDHLSKYRKKWSEQYGKYLDEPLHDIHSHASDSFRYTCSAISHLETTGSMGGALEKHRKLVDNRRKVI